MSVLSLDPESLYKEMRRMDVGTVSTSITIKLFCQL